MSGTSTRQPSTRRKADRFQEALVQEKEPVTGAVTKRRRRKKRKTDGHADDSEDEDYDGGSDEDEDDSQDDDEEVIGNKEVADVLPSKTAPEKSRHEQPPKRKRAAAKGPQASTGGSETGLQADPVARQIAGSSTRKSNPIYHFYEKWDVDAKGATGEKGDKHYRCRLGKDGEHKILTITKKMNSSLNGLTGHLRTHFPDHHTLYQVLHQRSNPPTADEIDMAHGKKPINDEDSAQHLQALDKRQQTLQAVWTKQAEARAAPFDQKKFESLLVNWLVACDHPFNEVEKPEFRALLEYLHSRGVLNIPKRTAITERVKALGKTTIAEIQKMIKELDCDKVSLTLDAWTSSNQLAFLAIVMTYVSNTGKLEELLIEFKEIIGAHSGDNMGDIVWKTICDLGLLGKVLAIVMDNASNNDTLMEYLAVKHQSVRVPFNARQARLRCMPHTIHLSATKLLEGIGAAKKKKGKNDNYQECVAVPMTQSADEEAALLDEDEDEDIPEDIDPSDLILFVVPKLRRIIRGVRGSPQSRKTWLQTATAVIQRQAAATADDDDAVRAAALGLDASGATSRVTTPGPSSTSTPAPSAAGDSAEAASTMTPKLRALMLILDVITRWSSSHQMISRALTFQEAIDMYTAQDKNNLRAYRLHSEDWDALAIVERWLQSFRAATLQMSATKRPMLSSVHAIFRGLQQSLREQLIDLPDTCHPRLKAAILDAHRKLSDYYWKFDEESPFYLWSAMLDPRIMYDGLAEDCTDEPGMTVADLERAKNALRAYFDTNYPERTEQPAATPSQVPATANGNDFTARYTRKQRKLLDELEEFWRRTPEAWGCDPIAWWFARRSEFPRLSRLALDILSIPGSAVAVERVFSGGRDTVSMRRASLSAEMIRVLMIAKQALRHARDVINVDED